MPATATSKPEIPAVQSTNDWPRKITVGRETVTVYRRKTPVGNFAFMVGNWVEGKRRFDSYSAESDALKAAETLAQRLDKNRNTAAKMTESQAVEYFNAVQELKALYPLDVSVTAAVSKLVEAVRIVGDLHNVTVAATFFAARHRHTVPMSVPAVVAKLLKDKEDLGASPRYLQDLRYRLTRFAEDCNKDCCTVTTSDVKAWLRGQKLGTQSYANFKRVLHLLFQYAMAEGYSVDNPVTGVGKVKVTNAEIEIFTPEEITRLLAAAAPDYLPCLALGAFAGLRSAEVERLEWSAIHLAERFIEIKTSVAKTASRRIVPISDNLAAWLAPYAEHKGKVWEGLHDEFYDRQQDTAAATAVAADPEKGIKAREAVQWKSNGLRHSYGSYRFAQTMDAGRTAGEMGNSATVVNKHYKQLVRPADAERWFAVRPEAPANVVTISTSAVS